MMEKQQMQNGDATAAPAPIYENRVVAFLDLLGFRDLIANRREQDIYDVLYTWPKKSEQAKAASHGRIELTAFSDSVVVSEVMDDGFSASRIVTYAGALALEMLARGILVRGGVAVGDLHHQEGIVFGPGLVAAYELESQLALYPRILVSGEVQRIVWDHEARTRGSFGAEMANCLFRRDFDGMQHLDLFGPFYEKPNKLRPAKRSYQSPEEGPIIMDFVHRLCSDAHEMKPRVAAKYEWLRSYTQDCRQKYQWPPR